MHRRGDAGLIYIYLFFGNELPLHDETMVVEVKTAVDDAHEFTASVDPPISVSATLNVTNGSTHVIGAATIEAVLEVRLSRD